MALSEKQMAHPRFHQFNHDANELVVQVARMHGFTVDDLQAVADQAGRVVDDLTALLLRLEREKGK